MDAFDRYGRELIEAGRRRRLGRPLPTRASTRRIVAIASLAAAVAIVGLAYTMMPAGSDVSAEAAALVVQVRRSLSSATPCRIVRGGAAAGVLRGVTPLPSTQATIAALRRPQTGNERHVAMSFTATLSRGSPRSALLRESLRILRGPNGLSAAVVVVRGRTEDRSGRVDPVGCLQRQLGALNQVLQQPTSRRRLVARLGRSRISSRAVAIRAETIVLGELAHERRRTTANDDRIFVAFRQHGQVVGTAAAGAAIFAREREVVGVSVPADSEHGRLLRGLVADGVRSIELTPTVGRGRVTASVVNNTFAVRVPSSFGSRLALTLRGPRREILRQVSLSL
jgi:hypothetical protein